MRFAVFVSSLIIALYPSLVFANLPAPTGRVLDAYQKKDGSWAVKVPGGLIRGVPKAVGKAGIYGYIGKELILDPLASWCKANKRKCAEKVGEDVVCVIVGNCEDDDTTTDNSPIRGNYCFVDIDKERVWGNDVEELAEQACDYYHPTGYPFSIAIESERPQVQVYRARCNSGYGVTTLITCDSRNKDEYDKDKKEKDLLDALKKLHDSLEDDEIKNIVNNYYGDDIDVEKQCNGAYSCTTINEGDDNDTTNNTTNNDNDTTNNTTKNDNDTTNNTTKKEDEDTTNNTKGKGDEDELECNDTDLSKAVCKIIDWLDDEAEDPDDQKAKIKDEDYDDDLDDDTINVSKGCPSNQTISYSMMGFGASIELPYHSICKFAQMVNPYVTASGAIVSFYIITGNRQS